jgi:hypothetical protein
MVFAFTIFDAEVSKHIEILQKLSAEGCGFYEGFREQSEPPPLTQFWLPPIVNPHITSEHTIRT